MSTNYVRIYVMQSCIFAHNEFDLYICIFYIIDQQVYPYYKYFCFFRTFTTLATSDEISPGLVSDGTKCGNERVSDNKICVCCTIVVTVMVLSGDDRGDGGGDS